MIFPSVYLLANSINRLKIHRVSGDLDQHEAEIAVVTLCL